MNKGLVAGAVAGMAGTWAMNEAQRLWTHAVDGDAPRESAAGRHDDLVYAVALAVWFAEKHPPLWPDSIGMGGGIKFPKGVFLTGVDLPSMGELFESGFSW